MAQRPSPSSLPSHIDDFQIMSPDHPNLQTLTSLYKKTTQAFLLRNYDTAYSLCMSAISKLADFPPVTVSPSTKIIQIKIWCLYINLVAALLAEKPPIVTEDHEIKRLLERPPEKICDELKEWDAASSFLDRDEILDKEHKKATQVLSSLTIQPFSTFCLPIKFRPTHPSSS
ncbi:7953_t:CDS:2 [Acaulospora colombiana]|uniref:7953_t:CDS:1 n=1 Tax=Acaulospora colombiana TaxID=27376 RepID=A0ACA9KAT4_9GLOM|nr:7953_t:CDS:2 [Acaulospora colombiana]